MCDVKLSRQIDPWSNLIPGHPTFRVKAIANGLANVNVTYLQPCYAEATANELRAIAALCVSVADELDDI